MKLEGLTINFLGDSITQGVGASCADTIYHAVLKREVNLKEARNYGIGGTRFARQHSVSENTDDRFIDENYFCARFQNMEDADAVVVFGGTNDYGHGDAPIGDFSDRTPDTFYGACHYLFKGLIKKYFGKPIVVITPLHRCDETKVGDNKVDERAILKTYVDIIREVAEYYSLPVLDLYKESMMQPEIEEIKEKYMPDGLHPSDDGYAVIAYKLKNFLERL